ncbi:MAG: hypothetical protein H6Q41_4449 [Deltaproteobacteria bacterium]|nr:hypothetical protein [Deltaproteobacteria bacterium]
MSNFKVQMKPKVQISKKLMETGILSHDSMVQSSSSWILIFDIPLAFEL